MLAMAFLFGALASQPAHAETPEALLAQMREACGGPAWDRVGGWHETGRLDLPGRPGIPYEAWHSMQQPPTAAYENRIGGQIIRRSGYDGTVAWQAGPDGQVIVNRDPVALRRSRRDAYLSNFGWFLPDRFPATFEMLGRREHEGRGYTVIRVTPEGGDSAELWVDPGTHRIGRLVAGNEHAELSDYRDFAGICTPTTGRQGDGDPAHTIILHVENVETGPVDAARFAPPSQP
jgi:hypothetical protein